MMVRCKWDEELLRAWTGFSDGSCECDLKWFAINLYQEFPSTMKVTLTFLIAKPHIMPLSQLLQILTVLFMIVLLDKETGFSSSKRTVPNPVMDVSV